MNTNSNDNSSIKAMQIIFNQSKTSIINIQKERTEICTESKWNYDNGTLKSGGVESKTAIICTENRLTRKRSPPKKKLKARSPPWAWPKEATTGTDIENNEKEEGGFVN
ncbi:hypothetical protein PanWU01x14_161760 [Parasponia andersonii]|uniref:Uncharacterized protein n=1 Tax=Parasponia andersonii TaxID=3476 RepID=A0A2P5CDH4_PARAD|nr:hypothetical protein PanWU01x14_161760 [Parasponia andersonii]